MANLTGPSGPTAPTPSHTVIPIVTNPTVEQATAQDAALTPPLQSVLDTLSGALNTTANTSATALKAVTDTLRTQAKTVGTAQQNAINSVVNTIGNAVTNNSMLSEAMLGNIVSTLAGSEIVGGVNTGYSVPQYTQANTHTVGGLPVPNATRPLPAPPGPPGIPGMPPSPVLAPPQPPAPIGQPPQAPPPIGQPPPVYPSPSPMPVLAPQQPLIPPVTDCNSLFNAYIAANPGDAPIPPQGDRSERTGQWLTRMSGWAALNGYAALATQCGGALTAQPPSGPSGPSGPAQIPPAPSPNCILVSGYDTDGSGFNSPNPPYGPVHWFCPPAVAPTPPSQPIPPATPTPPTPPAGAPPEAGCSLPTLNVPVQLSALPAIGSDEWCRQIQAFVPTISAIGGQIAAFFASRDTGFMEVNVPMNSVLSTLISALPFGIGLGIVAVYNTVGCVWNTFTSSLRNAIIAGVNVFASATAANDQVGLGLIVLRAAIRCLQNMRLGANAVVWATIDIRVQWEQAEAAIDYLILWNCPYGIPSVAEAMQLYRGGWISEGVYKCWMGMNNASPTVWQPVFDASRPRPSIGERQQLLWRLRPTEDRAGPTFTDDQYLTELGIDGSSDAWNQLQYAIRYSRYSLREIRQLIDSGQVTNADVMNAFRDMGFQDDKAAVLTSMEYVLTERRRQAEIVAYTPQKIAQLYMRGALQPADVIAKMGLLSYTADQAQLLMAVADLDKDALQQLKAVNKSEADIQRVTEESFQLGTIDSASAKTTLISLGATDAVANSTIAAWSAAALNSRVKSSISSIRKGFKSGYMPSQQIVALLQTAGLTFDKATTMLRDWQLEESVDDKTLEVSQILKAVADGNMSADTASTRLFNMGWEPNDAQLLLSESLSTLQKAQAELESKAMAAQEKAARAQQTAEKAQQQAAEKARAAVAKQAEQLAKQAQSATKAAAAALKKATPVASLNSWLKKGLISRQKYTERMRILGYDDGTIKTMMDGECDAKTAACIDTAGPDDANIPS